MGRSLRRRVATFAAALLVATGTLVAIAPTPAAHAELTHPRQEFLRSSTAGLFLHWGMRTAPAHTSCSAWENAVTSGGWNPNYWVDEAIKLHTQYLVFASFHSRLGYARAWPSSIPGSCRTTRDFLGETITAATAKGLKVILYMTDDPQWYNEGLPSGQSWLNSSAYSSYKGKSVNLHTRDGFGEFSYDNWVEVMQRYPNLAGFWVDNDNAYWERNGLYERVRRDRPNFTISNNNEDTPIMDMISNEQKTGMTPNYDYPQAVYTAAPRLIEACFKLPSSGPWWYGGSDYGVDTKLTLGRYITNVGSNVKALMAETAMKNGRFPNNQVNFNNFANGYLGQIWESLGPVNGGGYEWGGLDPGFWNDGAHGVTTVSKTDPNLHYVHVINRPSGSTLRLRDNGYKISRVTNLRTGGAISFTQSGGTLTINGVASWDPYDTVFKVETAGREGIYPASSYTMSASSSAAGHPASHGADGSYLTYWDNNGSMPASLRFDLGAAKRIQYLGINQRENSVTYPSGSSTRINGYRVYVSANGTDWGSPVKTGNLPNHRGVQIIDIPATTARHVRLEATSTYSGNRVRIDDAWVAGSYAASGDPDPDPDPEPGRYEAENATITQGTVDSNHAGYSGTGFVNYANATGSAVQWSVPATATGPVTLRFRHANGTTVDRPLEIRVNGTVVNAALSFPGTGAWTNWATVTVPVTLQAGANAVTATATTANGGPNVDYLEVAPG